MIAFRNDLCLRPHGREPAVSLRFAPMGPGKPVAVAPPDPSVALLLSILIPGLGHAYLRQVVYGVMFLVLAIGTWAVHLWFEPVMDWPIIAAHLGSGFSAWLSALWVRAVMERGKLVSTFEERP